MSDTIPAEKVRELSRGAWAKELYAVWSEPTRGHAAIGPLLERHRAYLRGLEAEGRLFAAGPLLLEGGEAFAGEGLIVLKAASLAEAHALAQADPLHAAGVRRFRIRPWIVNEGALTLTVRLSDLQATLS